MVESDVREIENCLRCFQFFEDSRVPVPGTVTEEVKEYGSGLYIIVETWERGA